MKHLLRLVATLSIATAPVSAQVVAVKRNVNLRPTPSTDQSPIRKLLPPEKAELLALSDSNGYYLIRTGLNEEGWVWGRNVEVSLDEVFLLGVPTYDRSEWRHWIDEDGDCQDARQEVLVRDADGPLTFRARADGRECVIEIGLWIDPFGGKSWTNPGDLDIDHMVPLRNAHFSGGWRWSRERKRAYANDLSDPEHLLAVRNSLNRSKGDRGPEEWLPPDTAAHCWYVRTWTRIKERWELRRTPAEEAAVAGVEAVTCPN